MEKIWLVIHEKCEHGDVSFNITPCKTEDKAKKFLHNKAIDIVATDDSYDIDTDDVDKEFCQDGNFIMERDGDKYFFITTKSENIYDSLNVMCKNVIE